MSEPGETSRVNWNRSGPAIDSDEVLAQLLDRGTTDDWRSLYRRAGSDPQLRARLQHIVLTVPLPLPRFWLAALVALGEPVDLSSPVPDYYERTAV